MTLFKQLNEEYNILQKSLKLKKREIRKLERQLEDILEKMEDENGEPTRTIKRIKITTEKMEDEKEKLR